MPYAQKTGKRQPSPASDWTIIQLLDCGCYKQQVEMAQQAKVLAAEPDTLKSIPEPHMAKMKDQLPQTVL